MKGLQHYINQYFPLFSSLKNYDKTIFRGDLIAGVTVGIMLIPQGMAYALIAGLPPEYGLYAALVPLIIYAFMGTSRHLAVGPVALVALLVASAVSPLAETPEEYIALSILLALMVGVIQLVFGFLKMGFLVNLLSHPVLSGFVSAAAIVIGFSQLHHLLGVDSVRGGLHEVLYGIALQAGQIHLWTLAVGLAGIALIIFVKKKVPAIPGPVLAVVAGILLIVFSGLDRAGVAIVGELSAGIPSFKMPVLGWGALTTLFPMALAIALVAFMEAIAVAKAIQQKSKTYQVDPNQELVALGTANIGGSFFQAFPITGSFSRTAVNFSTGASTGLSSIFSALTVALTLLLLTPVFYYLPTAILAAIIMVAVYGLIEFDEIKRLWKLGHYDRYMLLATFAGTLFLGIKEGIFLGVTLSVIMLLYRSARPNNVVLGRIPGTSIYRNINRYETEQQPEFLIFRFDAPLHFANAEYFKNQVTALIHTNPEATCLILDLNGVNEIDSTGLDQLIDVIETLQEEGINVQLAEVKAPVRDMLKSGTSKDKQWNFYMTIEDAVIAATDQTELKDEEHKIHTDN